MSHLLLEPIILSNHRVRTAPTATCHVASAALQMCCRPEVPQAPAVEVQQLQAVRLACCLRGHKGQPHITGAGRALRV